MSNVAVRLTPALEEAINRRRGLAFASGAELSKHDVIIGTLCAAFELPFAAGPRPGRRAKSE